MAAHLLRAACGGLQPMHTAVQVNSSLRHCRRVAAVPDRLGAYQKAWRNRSRTDHAALQVQRQCAAHCHSSGHAQGGDAQLRALSGEPSGLAQVSAAAGPQIARAATECQGKPCSRLNEFAPKRNADCSPTEADHARR